jgi:hypothetical protein
MTRFAGLAGPFVWRYGDRVFLRLELQHSLFVERPALNIVVHIYTEQEAKEEAGRSNDGLFYGVTREAPYTGQWASFPTRKHAVAIQKAYRGMKGRRKADQAREEYFRPGGRGYLAARNRFYAGAAAMAANRAAANMAQRR